MHGGSLCRRPHLTAGRPQGIGSLQRMPSLDAPAAAAASPDGDIELSKDRPARNLRLILPVDAHVDEVSAAAVGTLLWQRCRVHFIDSWGDSAAHLTAIFWPRLAAGGPGTFLWSTLGERRRLAFA